MLHSIIQCFEPECFLRIVISAICGFLIGCERERRAKNAGIRTHILVAISSTLMMEVSKYGFFDVVQYPGISVDASRVAAGVVTAIGFLGAGVIFVRKENTIGLTTSAGLWATVGMGIAIGAGMYATGIAFTIFILILQLLLHSRLLYSTLTTSAELSLIIEESNITIDIITDALEKTGLSVRNAQLTVSSDEKLSFTCRMVFSSKISVQELTAKINRMGFRCNIGSLRIFH